VTFSEFKDRKGEIITGIVRRFDKGNIIIELGRAEAILPKREQVQTETYRQGDRIQAYVVDITRAAKTPQVVLSRTHPGLLMKLFELEVPEVAEGIVRIEACAREPGFRAKIAVTSVDPDVDPVGACVGMKGSRVQAVVGELRGEAIDIVPYHPDPARFIVHAIAPAHVSRVYIDEHAHAMELVVPDDQLSKAIGRRGQNVRLAAQLTGWRIDIFSESKHAEMADQARDELSRIAGLSADQVEDLIRHGFRSAQEVSDAEAWEIAGVLNLEDEAAEQIVAAAETALEQIILEEADRRRAAADLPPDADEV
jgi:N utilization substance protein A